MVVVLDAAQSAEVALLALDLGMPPEEVVRHLLSEPLSRWEGETTILTLPC